MASKQKGLKACKQCKAIYEGSPCPQCGSTEFSEGFKGRITVIDPEQSEIAKHMKLHKKGGFAIKLG